jgi:hypothetical protein
MESKTTTSDKFGWLMLGMCVDYFIFRPVRFLRPLWYIGVGFAIGCVYSYGLGNIANFVKGLFV